MRKLIAIGAVWVFTLLVSCQGLEAKSIEWHNDYSKAVEAAREKERPLVLLFTGSDWCAWCVRLKEDILDTPEFVKAVGDEFVFVYVDFPSKTKLAEEIARQNRDLKQRYNVNAFPSVIVVDTEGTRLGMGNFTGVETPEGFAGQLRSAKKNANGLQNAMSQLDTLELSDGELKELYLRAKSLDRPDFAARLLERGVEVAHGGYFLAEKYRQMAQSGAECKELRAELLARDRHNEEGYVRMVAVLDFQQLAADSSRSTEEVIRPLISYLERYGSSDPSSRWRIHMTLAQYLSGKGECEEARQYAQMSLVEAPAAIQPEITAFLDQLEAAKI